MTRLVSIDWWTLGPVVAPAAGALLVLLLDALAPRLGRVHAAIGLLATVAGAVLTLPALGSTADDPARTLCLPTESTCLYQAGPTAGGLQLVALAAAAVVILLAWPSGGDPEHGGPAVRVCLLLTATAGAAGVAAAHDAGSWLVCLELATLPVVALVALRGTVPAGRGALALLMTSLVSFAMAVLGVALWVLATGRAVFARDGVEAALLDPQRRAVLVLAVLLLLGGLAFKLSLVPFHVWTPQAYAGGSEPVAAFLAATSKVAALAALLVVLGPLVAGGAPVLVAIGVVAAVSMTVGNVLALVQDDPVRLLAWSTVAQAGWVVLPLSALSDGSITASAGYLTAYVAATVVAFAVVHTVSSAPPARGVVASRRSLTAYTGLLRSHPMLGAALGLALVSLAGLPPGVLGLVAKVLALRPVVEGQQWALALVAVANAVLGVAVYLRWFGVMLRDPDRGPTAAVIRRVPRAAAVGLVVSTLVLAAACVAPQLLLGLVD